MKKLFVALGFIFITGCYTTETPPSVITNNDIKTQFWIIKDDLQEYEKKYSSYKCQLPVHDYYSKHKTDTIKGFNKGQAINAAEIKRKIDELQIRLNEIKFEMSIRHIKP